MISFERGTILVLFLLVAILIMLTTLAPAKKTVHAPRGGGDLLKLYGEKQNIFAQKNYTTGFITNVTRDVESLLIAPLSPKPEIKQIVKNKNTVEKLTKKFLDLGYHLEDVRMGYRRVPRLFLASMPEDIRSIQKPKFRK